MATYLAGMAIGQFDIRCLSRAAAFGTGTRSLTPLMADRAPAITAAGGAQFLYSEIGEPAYKRLTRTVGISPGRAAGSCRFFRTLVRDRAELGLPVRRGAHEVGGDDWTTLPDANGKTSTATGACPGFLDGKPIPDALPDGCAAGPGRPRQPRRRHLLPVRTCRQLRGVARCAVAWAMVGSPGRSRLPIPGTVDREVEVVHHLRQRSSSCSVRGVVDRRHRRVDRRGFDLVRGLTRDPLDGWAVPIPGPEGSADNPNTWDREHVRASRHRGSGDVGARLVRPAAGDHRLPGARETIHTRSRLPAGLPTTFELGYALENQTRPTYDRRKFGPSSLDSRRGRVAHRLPHQWYGDSVALDRVARHLAQRRLCNLRRVDVERARRPRHGPGDLRLLLRTIIPQDDPFWELAIGDPGPDLLFDFPVYCAWRDDLARSLRLDGR